MTDLWHEMLPGFGYSLSTALGLEEEYDAFCAEALEADPFGFVPAARRHRLVAHDGRVSRSASSSPVRPLTEIRTSRRRPPPVRGANTWRAMAARHAYSEEIHQRPLSELRTLQARARVVEQKRLRRTWGQHLSVLAAATRSLRAAIDGLWTRWDSGEHGEWEGPSEDFEYHMTMAQSALHRLRKIILAALVAMEVRRVLMAMHIDSAPEPEGPATRCPVVANHPPGRLVVAQPRLTRGPSGLVAAPHSAAVLAIAA